MDRMKQYKQFIKQLPKTTLVCAFGEFNPPTLVHEMLIKTVKILAEQKNSDHVVFTVPSKNPLLSEEKKEHYLKMMFPNVKFSSFSGFSEKYNKIFIIAGSETISELKKLKESDQIQIITINDKVSDTSKLKSIASKGIYEQFKKNLPSTIRDIDGRLMMNDIRIGLGLEPIKEQIKLVKNDLREQYFKGKIFNEGDLVESDNTPYTIVKRGSNHLLLKDSEGSLVSKWIHDVKIYEGVIQSNGTDQIIAATNSPVDKDQEVEKPKGKVKGFLTFYDQSKESMKESALNAKDPHDDYKAKNKAIQDIQMDPETHKDPELSKAVMQRKADLEKEYKKYNQQEDIVGAALVPDDENEEYLHGINHLRKQKVKHHLGEAKKEKVCDVCGKSPCECEDKVDQTQLNPTFDPFFKEEIINEIVESATEDDILEEYEEDEFIIIDEETGEELPPVEGEDKIDLMEVLSRQERMRQKMRLRKSQPKRSRSTKIALKRFSPPAQINKRARRLAIKLMKKRMLRGRDPSKVSIGEKERIEKALSKNKTSIDRIAAKLVARVRKVEKSRMSGGKSQKGAMPSVF